MLRAFLIYFSMIVIGLVIVNLAFRYVDHSTVEYGWYGAFGFGLTLSGFLISLYYSLKIFKRKKEKGSTT